MPKVAIASDDLIPTAEVAKMAGCDVATVARWVRDGRLTPAVQAPGIRGARLFRRSDVEVFIDKASA